MTGVLCWGGCGVLRLVWVVWCGSRVALIACAVGFVCGGVSVCVGDAGGVCIWLLNCFGCVV